MKQCQLEECLNTFEERSNKKFCSRKCKVKNKDRRVGNSKQRQYRRHRKTFCEKCGFIPVHICQLDVDHIDGNHKNNTESNLQTLCANCHRLKTFQSKDWEQKT